MKQTSNCSGFNAMFWPLAFLKVWNLFTDKNNKAKNPSRFTNLQEFILNEKNVNEEA